MTSTDGDGREAIHRGYRFDIEPSPKHIRIDFNGVTIADSSRAVVMRETRLAPVYYIPKDDVRMDLLERTDLHTHCPFKGNASYWNLRVGERVAENAIWGYEDPSRRRRASRTMSPSTGRKWMPGTKTARACCDPSHDRRRRQSVRRLADAQGAPCEDGGRAGPGIRRDAGQGRPAGLAPARDDQDASSPGSWHIYTWQSDADQIEVYHPTYEVLEKRSFQDSPFALILNGEGGIRRRLTGPSPKLDFPILEDLKEEGATDYVAIPLKFSDGQLNSITLVSKAPDGFTTEHLGELYEILPMLARVIEVHAMHRTAASCSTPISERTQGVGCLTG